MRKYTISHAEYSRGEAERREAFLAEVRDLIVESRLTMSVIHKLLEQATWDLIPGKHKERSPDHDRGSLI